MSTITFVFLEKEFPTLFNVASSAAFSPHTDPVHALFKLRQFGEKPTAYIFVTLGLDTPVEIILTQAGRNGHGHRVDLIKQI
ncbi:MAG TPA: hypothetical protein VD884_02200 [Ohtaekwangia sp.]|nr:hypothetical protein [Ohtaekwangia sp.]